MFSRFTTVVVLGLLCIPHTACSYFIQGGGGTESPSVRQVESEARLDGAFAPANAPALQSPLCFLYSVQGKRSFSARTAPMFVDVVYPCFHY